MARLGDFRSNTQLCLLFDYFFIFRIADKTTDIYSIGENITNLSDVYESRDLENTIYKD